MSTGAIRPLHPSMTGSQMWQRAPLRMTAMKVDCEMKDALTEMALSIFTDCVNSGKTFQDAILAVYLSGLEHGVNSSQGDPP